MGKTFEQRMARALQAARGEDASYQSALQAVRRAVQDGDDPRDLVAAEGGVLTERDATRWNRARSRADAPGAVPAPRPDCHRRVAP